MVNLPSLTFRKATMTNLWRLFSSLSSNKVVRLIFKLPSALISLSSKMKRGVTVVVDIRGIAVAITIIAQEATRAKVGAMEVIQEATQEAVMTTQGQESLTNDRVATRQLTDRKSVV